jgi:alkylhydroperoxidase family enzyme
MRPTRGRSEPADPGRSATRLSDRPGAVTDEIWAEAARHYDERQLGALVLMVALTNFFNRINTTFRVPDGTRWD